MKFTRLTQTIKHPGRAGRLGAALLYNCPMLLFLFLLFSAAPVNALVLKGVVSEVRDGQSFVIITGGRKLSVVLRGVDAPELKQEFGEVAQQHLASLVLNKPVEVDFSQLGNGYVVGKVFCNQMDIGQQMIRDGAAWYDKTTGYSLNEVERGVYANAQEAARNEMRGIWQNGSPMPPWEWLRAEAAKSAGQFTVGYKNNGKNNGGNDGRNGLQSEDILLSGRSLGGVGNSTGNPGERRSLATLSAKPTQKPLNKPGQDVNFSHYLNQGRISIVYFYADWCPACRALSPLMDRVNAQVPDTQVLFMDIGEWNTPVTQKYGITFVPHLQIYDKGGKLVAEGKAAGAWLRQQALGQLK